MRRLIGEFERRLPHLRLAAKLVRLGDENLVTQQAHRGLALPHVLAHRERSQCRADHRHSPGHDSPPAGFGG